MTVATVAPLTDIMGNAKLGADWDLEVQTGNNQGIGIKKPRRRERCVPSPGTEHLERTRWELI
ncbi:DUF4347 domain-containing protein [Nostoc sp.]|uniref:DUF4347 domain-containing protein n=1 Tax=Nostoc sp. TaxID=1180 RepID=UPI002FFD3817